MSILDRINIFKTIATRTADVVDELVLDKDAALKIKTEVELMHMELERINLEFEYKTFELKEASYIAALKTKTTSKVDAFHKLSRTLQSFYSMTVSAGVVLWLQLSGHTVTTEVVTILGASNIIGGVYTYRKGKGAPVND